MSGLFDYRGRIGRIEWWLLQTISLAGFVGGTMIVQNSILLSFGNDNIRDAVALFVILPLMFTTLWIAIAASIKRYHERGKSGYWIFIIFVPFGIIAYLIECGFLGSQRANKLAGDDDLGMSINGQSANDHFDTDNGANVVVRSASDSMKATPKTKSPGFGRRENYKCPPKTDQTPFEPKRWRSTAKAQTLGGDVIPLRVSSASPGGRQPS